VTGAPGLPSFRMPRSAPAHALSSMTVSLSKQKSAIKNQQSSISLPPRGCGKNTLTLPVLLFDYPDVPEGRVEFFDLVVVDTAETCELNLTLLDGAACASADVGYPGRILLLPCQRIKFAPIWVARIAQGGAPSSGQFSKLGPSGNRDTDSSCQPRRVKVSRILSHAEMPAQ